MGSTYPFSVSEACRQSRLFRIDYHLDSIVPETFPGDSFTRFLIWAAELGTYYRVRPNIGHDPPNHVTSHPRHSLLQVDLSLLVIERGWGKEKQVLHYDLLRRIFFHFVHGTTHQMTAQGLSGLPHDAVDQLFSHGEAKPCFLLYPHTGSFTLSIHQWRKHSLDGPGHDCLAQLASSCGISLSPDP